jgi:hypothetical protein
MEDANSDFSETAQMADEYFQRLIENLRTFAIPGMTKNVQMR